MRTHNRRYGLNSATMVSLCWYLLSSTPLMAQASSSSPRFAQASFVPPASPTATRSGPLPFYTPVVAVDTTLDKAHPVVTATTTTALEAKKKGTSTSSASKKIQVKLLKHVKGTGQAGDVVQVTPAFFNNKLRPTSSAKVISDEQVSAERQEQQALEDQRLEQATDLRNQLQALADDDDNGGLTIFRKAGPTGQLFGGVHAKTILETAQQHVPHEYWTLGQKSIQIVQLLDGNGKKMRNKDIKHTGEYAANIALTRDLSVKVPVRVVDQDSVSP